MAHRDPDQLRAGDWVRLQGRHTWLANDPVSLHTFAAGTLGRIDRGDDRYLTVAVLLADLTIAAFSWVTPTSVALATPSEEELDRWAIAALAR